MQIYKKIINSQRFNYGLRDTKMILFEKDSDILAIVDAILKTQYT